ncbi:MAG: hypothetical protein ABWZ98_13920 [Nakamurella sp.]
MRREIGPEIDELRRQVADLQSLKEIQELRDLRDLHPKRLIGKNILGDEFSGGITGFLGLTDPPTKPSAPGPGAVPYNDAALANGVGSGTPNGAVGAGPASNKPTNAVGSAGSATRPPSAAPPSMTKLAAPKVVGQFTPRATAPPLAAGERPPFDPDGT